jgi:hypothetical protein
MKRTPFSVIDLLFLLALSLELKRFVACLSYKTIILTGPALQSQVEGGGNFAALSFLRTNSGSNI